jgi:acyl carrier protein
LLAGCADETASKDCSILARARSPARLRSHDTLAENLDFTGPRAQYQHGCIADTRTAELAELIVSALNLEGVEPQGIDPDAALFGAGLGLDSIDALELALEMSKRYGVQLKADDEDNQRIFASLRALSDYVQQRRAA